MEQTPYSGDTRRIDAVASQATRPFDLPRHQQPRRRSSLVILAALGCLLAIVVTLADVTNVGWNVSRTTTTTEQFATRNLVLDVGSGTVTLVGSDAAGTTVDMTRQGWGWSAWAAERALERVRPTITQDGDTLRITTPARSAWTFFGRSPSVDVRVTLPHDGIVQATTGSGEMEVTELAGALTLRTGSGNINGRGVAGTIYGETGSGEIALHGSTSRELDLRTGSGAITVDGAQGTLSATTGSGKITINNAIDAALALETSSGDIAFRGSLSSEADQQAATGSGNISLQLPANTSVTVDAETGLGRVTSDWNTSNTTRQIGTEDLSTPTLRLRTGSGDITLTKQ